MKNKKLVYVLLPAVLIIWAIIFYRLFFAVDGGHETAVGNGSEMIPAASSKAVPDTFDIIDNYRDPFLGKTITASVKRNTSPASMTQVKKQEPLQKSWPPVVYSGMIRNQQSKAQLAMLQVNGQSYTLKSGEAAEDIQLLRVFRDSVEVKFQNEKRFIRK